MDKFKEISMKLKILFAKIRIVKASKKADNFLKKYDYKTCLKCDGNGYIYIPGNYHEPEDIDLCTCLESGNCPQCGELVERSPEENDYSVCLNPKCNWTDCHKDFTSGYSDYMNWIEGESEYIMDLENSLFEDELREHKKLKR